MTDFAGLSALYVNTSLKRSAGASHTQLLMEASAGIMEKNGVTVERVHMLDHVVPPGVYPDMTAQGWPQDDFPQLWKKIDAANILVIGSPIWLGSESSVSRVLIERLYGMSGELNDRGQSVFYGKAAGCVVTGNEDGIKHVAQRLLYALSHLGYAIPPQADCGWIGPVGPGPSYGDEVEGGGRAGFDSAFTQRNCAIMSWNLMHFASMLRAGIPSHGNDRRAYQAGCSFDFENPEHRS